MGEFQKQYIVNERGEKTAVILPIGEYQELLEDIHDLAIIAERRDEPTVTLEEVKQRLREDGLLLNPVEAFGGTRAPKHRSSANRSDSPGY